MPFSFFRRWTMTLWLTCIWLIPFSVIFGTQALWEESVLGYSLKYGACLPKTAHPQIILFNGLTFLIAFPLNFVIIVTSFVVIYVHLKRHSSDLIGKQTRTSKRNGTVDITQSGVSSPSTSVLAVSQSSVSVAVEDNTTKLRLQRRQVQITKNMMFVVCVFFACIAPYACGTVIPNTAPSLPYLSLPVYFNSCVNPLIYAKHPHFREVFSFILRGKWNDIPQKTALLKSVLMQTSNG